MHPVATHMRRWSAHLLALAAVLALLVGLYWTTVVTMVGIWHRSDTFAHAFLVLPISLWLVWRQRAVLRGLSPQASPWMLAPLAVMAAMWLVGDLASVNAVTQFAWVAMLVLSVPAVLGLQVAWAIAFPLVFLLFMVPVGEFMMPQFMEWTADFTVGALQLSGIPVYREGLQFVIPTGSWSVVEACSGVRYMIASFMVGSLYAYLNYTSTSRRLIFCVVSLIVPLVANWLRAYMIVMIGHFSGNTLAVGVDHLVYGWAFFGVVIMLMFFIGARWAQMPADAGSAALAAGGTMSAPVSGFPAAVFALVAAVMVAPHALNVYFNAEQSTGLQAPLVLPALTGTQAAAMPLPFEPTFRNPSATASRSYGLPSGRVVTVHLAFYRHQGPGRKLVSSENVLLRADATEWQRVASGIMAVEYGGQTLSWRSATLLGGAVSQSRSTRPQLEVRQSYWVNDRYTPSDKWALGHGLIGRLSGRGDAGAMITVFMPAESAKDASAELGAFLQQHLPAIEAQLSAYRGGR